MKEEPRFFHTTAPLPILTQINLHTCIKTFQTSLKIIKKNKKLGSDTQHPLACFTTWFSKQTNNSPLPVFFYSLTHFIVCSPIPRRLDFNSFSVWEKEREKKKSPSALQLDKNSSLNFWQAAPTKFKSLQISLAGMWVCLVWSEEWKACSLLFFWTLSYFPMRLLMHFSQRATMKGNPLKHTHSTYSDFSIFDCIGRWTCVFSASF